MKRGAAREGASLPEIAEVDVPSFITRMARGRPCAAETIVERVAFIDPVLDPDGPFPEGDGFTYVFDRFSPDDISLALSTNQLSVHITSHSRANMQWPLLSSLDTNSGPLFLLDLVSKQGNAGILEINSCSSGADAFRATSHALSFMRLAVANGVGVAVGNLDPVDNDRAVLFSRQFQLYLGQEGKSPARAFAGACFEVNREFGEWPRMAIVANCLESAFCPPTYRNRL